MSGEQLEPGTLLNDRYRIIRVIGQGGMGTVYQAEHVRLDTILAVKEVRAPQTAGVDLQSLLEQCEHEARFLVKLHHPNLPQVTDAFLERCVVGRREQVPCRRPNAPHRGVVHPAKLLQRIATPFDVEETTGPGQV